ncbi:acyl-CoA dehydrogenase family protein [Mycolicibacterium sp.]|uniref:acyl-CoA dehydrogenase family protein n=1 Tax=Mycolicibacterium sp. TaxID=2320850 RepID=UPI001A34C072|nr:acyl-CoA dehydrogenase family protein [Mycolicibacterium sp.]MBJ7337523.1 acyl-CoA/acyl-ACP dehydrogenase [Mycolicibacterium sp.]
MHWELSDEQNLYTESVRDWLAAHAAPDRVRRWLEAGDHRSLDNALIDDGWAGVGFDEAAGGQGGSVLELALTARELGRTAAPSGCWLARAVADAGLLGEPELTRAMLEQGEITAVAVRCDRIPASSGLHWHDGRVSGEVPSVLGAEHAHRFLVPVALPDGGLALAIVERDGNEVRVRPRDLLDRSRNAADVTFDSAPGRLTECDDATGALSAVAHRAAALVAADALGAGERMLAMSVEYAKQRTQFGRPIAAFQAVKHAAAQMLVTVEAGYSVALFAAASLQDGAVDSGLHAAAAKAQVTADVATLADSALTVHGAIGYTWEYDLQLFYKRAKLNHVLFGAPSAWNERIAAALPLIPVAS